MGPGMETEISPIAAALRGCCPRCGNAPLFASFLSFAPRCRACGLDYQGFNVGDGPAAFLTLGIGALVTLLAVMLELAAEPPFWVHVVMWLPLTALLVIVSLRFAKAGLLGLEYRHRAREGRARGDE